MRCIIPIIPICILEDMYVSLSLVKLCMKMITSKGYTTEEKKMKEETIKEEKKTTMYRRVINFLCQLEIYSRCSIQFIIEMYNVVHENRIYT